MFDVKYDKPFVFDRKIQLPWKCKKPMFGHAFTCTGGHIWDLKDMNDEIRIEMFDKFTPGCVQVLDADFEDSVALFGDVSGRIAKKFGAVGAVIDAATRDVGLLEDIDFPVFCKGVNMCSALNIWQIEDYQVTIYPRDIYGDIMTIEPNDYIFGDGDGVLCIPKDILEDVLHYAEGRMESENTVRAKIQDASVKDLLQMKKEMVVW
jgi:regulator of RNase E activity RraA